MLYAPPYGSADPNAGYIDRNTPGAVQGSKVPARAVEQVQRELMAVILSAGLTPSATDMTQVLQAIQWLISQATGEGGDANYVLMTQARARLPIFADVATADGKIPVFSPSNGTIRVPAGYTFVHRGIFLVTTVEQNFATVANKTYHLRWNPTDGFALKDHADGTYNPSADVETHIKFDTQLDDVLFTKVVTNGANVPDVKNLANKARLENEQTASGAATPGSTESASFTATFTLDWSRRPLAFVDGLCSQAGAAAIQGYANDIAKTVTRYSVVATVTTDWNATPASPQGKISMQALR